MSPKPRRKARHKLSQEWKFAARTAPELYERFYGFVAAMAGRAGVKFRNRKLGREAVLNAIVIHFLDQPEEEQVRLLRAYVPRYEAILGDAPDVEADLDAPEASPAPHAARLDAIAAGEGERPGTHEGLPLVPVQMQEDGPGAASEPAPTPTSADRPVRRKAR